ncbi:hypothetical protein ATI02_1952 [Pseudomonas baetica]|uniref:Carboxypeptidase regulatory-like domain-containing protein n=1 Tax=Pseudomonas baetica TaxID=674054 RepID=A0ABX4PVY8_9PSED|nr:hypothetical protein [Pseudomonas baetica]PKA69130.1 hypothetical protein ATI02_1952 [Pseudomonas baetica]PTC20531.1 hypothetical protein C0J26_06035 [Pseudomonas baetica]
MTFCNAVPTITLLTDHDGAELGERVATSRLPVTIDGIASSSSLIAIHDNGYFVGKVFAGVSGFWSFRFPPLSLGKHEVFVKNKAGESAVRMFEVIAAD